MTTDHFDKLDGLWAWITVVLVALGLVLLADYHDNHFNPVPETLPPMTPLHT